MPLHPQAKEFLETLERENPPAWNEMSPDEGRQMFAGFTELFGQPQRIASVMDDEIRDGLIIRIYRPDGEGPFPGVLYFHGGGWVLGDRDTHDVLCRHLANAAKCVVAAVDYHRAPEHKFPAAMDDCYFATQHVANQAPEYEIDALKLAVAGDSAGGNLAAATALRARDEKAPAIAFQLLIYPVLQYKFNTDSYRTCADGYGLTRGVMRWFWQQYLSEGADPTNPYAAPMEAIDLSDLPPAHIITAEYDVLRDEGETYAHRLTEAGVPTTLQCYDGMIHGFFHFAGVFDTGRQAIDDAANVLHQRFHN